MDVLLLNVNYSSAACKTHSENNNNCEEHKGVVIH